VLLCEQDDLASGTSSRSGKLVHGGLRYLEYCDFRLVREALIEREVLLAAAPHIIWPLRFVLPHSPEQRPAWLIRLGLFLYDHLGGRRRLPGTRTLDLRTAPEGRPLRQVFEKAFEYSDCWVDDARLVVLNALDAAERGAVILTRTQCIGARRVDGRWQAELACRETGQRLTVSARALVNAAGPWVEQVLGRVAGVDSRRRIRLVKGSHIVTEKFWDGPQAYLLQNTDRRVIFVNPYEGDLALIGTTDIAVDGDPEEVAIEPAEIDYLLAVVNRYFARDLRPADVLHSFAGVRPLYDDEAANPSAITRDYVFEVEPERRAQGLPPLLSVFGGKITTYRKLAEHALEKLAPFLGELGPAWTAAAPLPGGDMANADFDAFLAKLRRACLAAGRPRRALRPALRHAHPRPDRRCYRHRGPGPAYGRPALCARGRLSLRRRMGADRGGHSRAPHQARPASERRPEAIRALLAPARAADGRRLKGSSRRRAHA
jgi:glycerol-3-phosphate dehydrogenase